MKKIVLLLLISLPFVSAAQEQLKHGFIVKANHDTLKGFLKPVSENELTNEIFFSEEASAHPSRFTTADVVAFGFDGENRFARVRYVHPIRLDAGERFAKFLTDGYYRLYTFTQQDRKYFVINSYEDSTYLLFDDKFTSFSGTVDEAGNYRSQLLYLSVSCDSLKNNVEHVDYTQAAIATYVDKLNRCISPSETNAIVYKKDKSYVHLYAYAGGISFSNKYELAGRITARITIPDINKNMSVNVGLNMMANKKIYTVASHFNGYVKTRQTEYRYVFSVPFTVEYDFLMGNIKPYVEAGLSLVYLDAHITQDYLSYKNNDRKFGLGVIGAIGVEGYVTKRLMIKADWHYELFLHYPTIGIGYIFN